MASRRRARGRVLATLALVPALALPLGAGGVNQPLVQLVVVVRGGGSVDAKPGAHTCRIRCVWRFQRGARATFSARPAAGSAFAGWGGACSSARSACTFKVTRRRTVVARFGAEQTPVSWSPHVHCTPVLTSVPEILGSEQNAAGGATEAGGRFQPHLRGGTQQHLLNPPCNVDGTPAFVEIHDVVISRAPNRSSDGDDSTNLTQADRPDITNPNLKTIHVEIDGTWIAAGVNPPFWPEALGTRLDVQGFVFWDPAHLDDAWHGYSGWELHPVAAWRIAS
ncbi:MAG TPA: hypothetical protein VF101_00350 [Gaiellaceae bacterium]